MGLKLDKLKKQLPLISCEAVSFGLLDKVSPDNC